MGGTTASTSWDEVWAAFDARQPARSVGPRAQEVVRAAKVSATGSRRLLALIGAMLLALYAASPLVAAVQVASAIQRLDVEALAARLDWESLRPTIASALAAQARNGAPQPMPDFIAGLARDMTARLAEPEALARLLHEGLGHRGPAREMLGRIRVVEAGLWEVSLSPPHAPQRAARLTLALADPLRLRWEVRGIELPSRMVARQSVMIEGAKAP